MKTNKADRQIAKNSILRAAKGIKDLPKDVITTLDVFDDLDELEEKVMVLEQMTGGREVTQKEAVKQMVAGEGFIVGTCTVCGKANRLHRHGEELICELCCKKKQMH